MKTAEPVIGVRQLRARLSTYLGEVARGGSVTIGDRRRRPVARLVPVRPAAALTHVEQLATRGVVQLGSGKPGGHLPIKPRRPRRSLFDIVIEDRR